MAKKPTIQSKRREARRIYLTGECDSNAEIARRLEVKPHTVGRWRKDEAWDDLRLKVDRRAAEQMVEKLAGERTTLNLRHYKFWDVLLGHVGTLLGKNDGFDVRELERIGMVVDRAQKGQRLARGLSLSGENEEQIRAQADAEARELVDAFVEAVTTQVEDETVRDRIREAVLERLPGADANAKSGT